MYRVEMIFRGTYSSLGAIRANKNCLKLASQLARPTSGRILQSMTNLYALYMANLLCVYYVINRCMLTAASLISESFSEIF